jgi:hypothetical protein
MSDRAPMDDTQLAAEIRRRADSVSLGGDWARHELLPAVNLAIDTRPQRVATPRWSALAGLAGVATILLVLVVAMPRVVPGPSSSSSASAGATSNTTPAASAPPVSAVIETSDFAARLAAGSLDGQTVLVNGLIGPNLRRGPTCLPRAGLCYLGPLEGTDPVVDVSASWIRAPEGVGTRFEDQGSWPWWSMPGTSDAGSLVLKVDLERQVQYVGFVEDSGASSPQTVQRIAQVDPADLSVGEVVLVDGWLNDSEGPGVQLIIDCVYPPPGGILPDLPSRYCQATDWLASERRSPDDTGPVGITIQVQRSAGQQFGQLVDSAHAVFALSGRLYGGGCGEEPPCWLWDVVGRLTPPPPETGEPTPSLHATPVTGVRFECVGPPLPPDVIPHPGPIPAVIDVTGLVEACAQTDSVEELLGSISVSNPFEDDAVEVVWAHGLCDASIVFTFRAADAGYELVGDRPSDCSRGADPLPIYIRFTQAIPAELIAASLDGVAGPAPSTTPTPISRTIECPIDPEGPESDLAPRTSFVDQTGLVSDCEAFAGTPEFMIIDWSKPTIRNSGPSQLQVIWRGSVCDLQAEVLVTGESDAVEISIRLTDEYTSCDSGSAGYLVLNTAQPVDAATATASIERASDVPDPNPPPIPPPTGDPALIGQTLECPYSDPVGRPTEISIIDHGGFILGCEASSRSERPTDQVALSNGDDPATLDFRWQVDAMCTSMPAQLEFWGPWRYDDPREWSRSNFRLRVDIQAAASDEPNACLDVIGTQSVLLTMNMPIPAAEVIAFKTRGTTSTDSVETSAAPFAFSLAAGAAEYAANMPIDIAATLTYLGADPVTIAGDSTFIAFGFEQLDGHLGTTPVSILMCGTLDLEPGQPLVVPFRKNGGYSNRGPDVEFYRQYFQDPELRLPQGTYRIFAGVGFNIGSGSCYDDGGYGLDGSIVIHVR